MDRQLQSAVEVAKYMLAGDAIFTVKNIKSGNHFTFKVTMCKSTLYWVSVLAGPDPATHYQYKYMGSIYFQMLRVGQKSRFTKTKGSQVSEHALSFQVFKAFFKILNEGRIAGGVEVWRAQNCGRCGRTLTDPVSIENGIGPICRQHQAAYAQTNFAT